MKRFALSALLLSVVAVWGWTFVVVKDAVALYGVVPFLTVRFIIGTAVIGPFAVRRLNWRTAVTGGAIGLVLGAAYLFQTFGLDHGTATNTGVITGLAIIFAPLANRVLFSVRTTWVLWCAIGVSVVGLGLLTMAGYNGETVRDGLALGDALTLGCAACFGLHVALLDRFAKQHDATVLAWGQLAVASMIFLSLSPISGSIPWPTPGVWFALLVTGVLATAGGFFIQTFVQQRLSAVQTAMIIAAEPVFALMFGYLLAGDRLNAVQLVGAALMFGAIIAAQLYPLLGNRDSNNT